MKILQILNPSRIYEELVKWKKTMNPRKDKKKKYK